MMKTIKSLLLILLITSSFQSRSQNCCSGGVPMAGNLGLPAGESGSWQISVNYDLNLLRTLKEGTRTLELTTIDRLRTTQSALLSIGYNFTPRISLESFISYVRQARTITNNQLGTREFTYAQGLGDAALLVKYRVTAPANTGHIWQIGAGVKFPTGPSDQRRPDGIALSMDLQPGSGSWDGLFWTRYTHYFSFRPSMSFTANAAYSLRGTNPSYLETQTFQIGDDFQVLAGVADRFQIKGLIADPSISLRFRIAERDLNNGEELTNTGGAWIFWVPGFSLLITPSISWQSTIDIPLYAHIKGTQLTPSFRLNTGFFFQINSANNEDKLNIFE